MFGTRNNSAHVLAPQEVNQEKPLHLEEIRTNPWSQAFRAHFPSRVSEICYPCTPTPAMYPPKPPSTLLIIDDTGEQAMPPKNSMRTTLKAVPFFMPFAIAESNTCDAVWNTLGYDITLNVTKLGNEPWTLYPFGTINFAEIPCSTWPEEIQLEYEDDARTQGSIVFTKATAQNMYITDSNQVKVAEPVVFKGSFKNY